jgi:predicted glutamine amidotransferase
MCIIVFDGRKSRERLPFAALQRCQDRNADGMGIVWVDPVKQRLRTWRTMDDLSGLWQRYTSARSQGWPVGLHFRIATFGTKTLRNCHPFAVSEDLAVMHNGTLTWTKSVLPEGVSDTQAFTNSFLRRLPEGFLNEPMLVRSLEELASGDRMLFLDSLGNHTIVNKSYGFEHDGVWFSHNRDRDYIIEGKKYKTWEHEAWWKAEQQTEITPITHYDRRSSNKKSKKSKKSQESRPVTSWDIRSMKSYTEKSSGLYFAVGYDRQDILGLDNLPGETVPIGLATMHGAQLWAYQSSDTLHDVALMRTRGNDSLTVKGWLYLMRDHAEETMKHMDGLFYCKYPHPEESVHYRYIVPVRPSGLDLEKPVWAWTYVARPSQLTDFLGVVPFGDWSVWVDRQTTMDRPKPEPKPKPISVEPKPLVTVITDSHPQRVQTRRVILTPRDGSGSMIYTPGDQQGRQFQCVHCTSRNTQVFSSHRKSQMELVFCHNCESHTPLEGTIQ